MAGKRDYVSEIHDRRLRIGTPNHIVLMFDRVRSLLEELERAAELSDELMRYFPIAMVACIETYTRSMVQELIDDGPPYSERMDAFENVKLEMSTMKAIHGRRITLGELIAHLIPVKNLQDIKRAIGTLLDSDLVGVVRDARDKWKSRVEGRSDTPIVQDIGAVIRGVEWTFKLRHMYAHEFPARGSINRELITDSVRASATFLMAADEGIRNLRYPDMPLTQAEMNRYAAEELQKKDDNLKEWIADFAANLRDDHAAMLGEAQDAWETVRDRTARLMADLEAEGGSMWPMVYSRAAERITRHRLDEVQALVELSW